MFATGTRSSSATSRHRHKGIKATRTQYGAWLATELSGAPRKMSKHWYPKARIFKDGRVVFNIKGNDYRLISSVQYQAGVLAIGFFGTHAEYDKAIGGASLLIPTKKSCAAARSSGSRVANVENLRQG